MKIRFKKLHEDAVLPIHAKPGDAGVDLTAVSEEYDKYGNIVFDTGIAVEIPEGYVGLVFPRSSITKTQHLLKNSVGVIDSGYRGSIVFKFTEDLTVFQESYKVGDRIGQLVIVPYVTIESEFVDELSSSERGDSGFGSTGK